MSNDQKNDKLCHSCNKFFGHLDGKCTLCFQNISQFYLSKKELHALLQKMLGREKYVASNHIMRTLSCMIKNGISLLHMCRFIKETNAYFRVYQVVELISNNRHHEKLCLFHLFMPFVVDYWNCVNRRDEWGQLPVCYYYDDNQMIVSVKHRKGHENKKKALRDLENDQRVIDMLNRTVDHRLTEIPYFIQMHLKHSN